MVAAICYAWLLENKTRKEEEFVTVPVMNVKRGTMWKLRQASWLFYHAGLDVASLLFSDEVIFHLSVIQFLQFRLCEFYYCRRNEYRKFCEYLSE